MFKLQGQAVKETEQYEFISKRDYELLPQTHVLLETI